MILVLKPDLTEESIRAIEASVEKAGGRPVLIEGRERSVVAVIGTAKLDPREFELLPGVSQVLIVGKPYKLASREVKREDTVVRVGDLSIGGDQIVVMAGPCSVENRPMLLETARRLSAMGVSILRGGAFKPRTSPYAFQGLGEEGLKILAEAREMTGMKVVTEVMSPERVELVARYADLLQIGARNMQNFDLLKEVAEVKKPVLLKRGFASTIDEWLQAAEYVLASNRDVILCERGIRTFETSTRNTLDLNAIPVLHERTHLPVLVDPSHGTGVRSCVAPMALAAIAAGADGLIIEVHPEPEKAFSDGPQSLTPEMLARLLRDVEAIAPVVGRRLALSTKRPATVRSGTASEAVAFQGEPGAFSERAARSFFGEGMRTIPSPSFRDVFERVARGECGFGIVPVENSLTGSIHPNYELLLEHEVTIVGEVKLRIVHNLIALPGVTPEQVKRVYAHPQAAAQCERFLRVHPEWSVLQVYDTAGSVKMIRDEGARDGAAIASTEAAQRYGMEILREAIENDAQNYTRFLVLAAEARPNPAANKVSLAYGTKNEPGSLLKTLQIFADRGINLLKLESRPIAGRPWEYLFYVDLSGNVEDRNVAEALVALRRETTLLKVLGGYPSA